MSDYTHVHEPAPAHTHDHAGHSHDDHHHQGDSYFTDQLCMVGLSGAFGMICLCLYFWQTAMLENMLAKQFHLFVLLSGMALVMVAFARGFVLWQQSRDPRFVHSHDQHDRHDHEHDHQVKEGAPLHQAVATQCGHEHKPGEVCAHDHAHPHEHHVGHAHAGHDHDEADHDHGWAPWRYVVILVPIIFFLLGLPSKSVNIGATRPEQLIGDFTSIVYEAMPFIVLGVLLAGLLEEFVPQQAITRVFANSKALVVFVASVLGIASILSASCFFYQRNYEISDTWVPIFNLVSALSYGLAAWSGITLAAAGLAEVIHRFLFPSFFSGKLILTIGIGAVLGLVFPMCECGIIVVMKRLLRKGLPLSVCVAYMLAGPVINFVVMTSTIVAFSSYDQPGKNDVLGGPWQVVAWRVGLSYLVACITALVVDWQWQKYGNRLLHPSVLHGLQSPDQESVTIAKRPWSDRLNNITQTALHDFVDIMAFLILGAILAAGGKFIIRESNVQQFLQETPAIAILMMMGIAILFCLCSEADAFVAANFPLFWPDSSKLAFLVLGPMLDFKLLLMYTRVYRPRLIYTIVGCLLVQVFAYTMIVEYAGFGRKHPPDVPPITLSPNVETYLLGIGTGDDPLAQLVHFGVHFRPSERGVEMPYKQVKDFADRDDLRRQWEGKTVEVRGQYNPQNEQFFMLTRFRISCCASDATAEFLPVVARENIMGIAKGDWIKVSGRVEFREIRPGQYSTLLVVSRASDVEKCNPETNPYIQ